MRKITAFLVLLYPTLSWSDAIVQNHYAQGKAFSQSSEVKAGSPTDVSTIPGYQDPSKVPQSSLTGSSIGGAVQKELQENKEAAFLTETYNTRPRFELDVATDPLFIQGDDLVVNAETHLKVKESFQQQEIKTTRHKCIKGYDLSERRCRWTNVPIKTGTRKEKKIYTVNLCGYQIYHAGYSRTFIKKPQDTTKYLWRIGYYNADRIIAAFKALYKGIDAASGKSIPIPLDKIVDVELIGWSGEVTYRQTKHERAWGPQYKQFQVTTEEEVPVFKLEWQNNCDDLEILADQGNCEYATKHCVGGAGTKIIEGVELYADCWEEEAVYQCRTHQEDTCKSLLQEGCAQIGSKCLVEEGQGSDKRCLKWEQTYDCYEGDQKLAGSSLSGAKPFCLDGDCAEQGWAPNQDMADSLSKLAIFSKMKGDMDARANTVFKGTGRGCSRSLTGFKDCCKMGGWGKSIGLAGCDDEARQLAEHRAANKCILVGTYCAEKKLGVCIRKKTNFCCYESKLARIIHEQGKAQLGLSFGSPEHPQCQALTLDQLTKIDFSKVDFSELFEELFSKTKIPDTMTLKKDIQKSMSDKTYFKTDKEKQITQGRSHGNF